jgi:hypothetical protein
MEGDRLRIRLTVHGFNLKISPVAGAFAAARKPPMRLAGTRRALA